MKYVIYRHTHRDSGRCYVGYTKYTMEQRWKGHVAVARYGSHYPLHQAIREYGSDAFDHQVIDAVETLVEAKRLERQYIKDLNSQVPTGFNRSKGGGGHGGEFTQDALQRIGAAASVRNKGRTPWNKGVPTSPEAVAKRLAAMKLNPKPVWNKGKKMKAKS